MFRAGKPLAREFASIRSASPGATASIQILFEVWFGKNADHKSSNLCAVDLFRTSPDKLCGV
jgi:hypothetical protein